MRQKPAGRPSSSEPIIKDIKRKTRKQYSAEEKIRTLMIHGARAVVARAKHKDDRLSRWVTNIANKKHPNVAAVALANKTARMAWAMLRHETDYDPDFAIR